MVDLSRALPHAPPPAVPGLRHRRDGREVQHLDPAEHGAEPRGPRAAGDAHERRGAGARPRPAAARRGAGRARRQERQVAR